MGSLEEKSWLKESVCVILLFDITNPDSFYSVVTRAFEETKKIVHESLSFFMLIGNKLDLEDSR